MRTSITPEKLLKRLQVRLELYEVVDGVAVFDDSQNLLLEEILESAKWRLLNARYGTNEIPLNENDEPYIDARWIDVVLAVSVKVYNKIGAEGQKSHIENSIHRAFEEESEWLASVPPLVGIVR